ncbi:hypothetical protein Tco_0665488 [Tanacetum coccineum]
MDPNSSLGRICLGDDVIVISSDKAEGSGDWNSPEYQDTAVSKGKEVINGLSFYRMETDEISERYIAQCFVNGLEAFDGEINLAFDENLISNEFAVKLCLDYEVKKGKKLVKKELIVALKGELYFVKFIIKPKEDDFIPGVILGRSFLRLSCRIVDFGKSSDDWDQLLDFNFDDVPKSGEELPPFVCKMGKSNRNKKREMENFNLFYQDVGPSASAGRYLTQEEAAKEELAIRISQRYALLEEECLFNFGMYEEEVFFSQLDGICINLPSCEIRRSENSKSDTDDEEEYVIKRNKFGEPIYGPRPTPYLKCANPEDRSSAIQAVTNPFRKISVWKKAGTHDGEAGSSRSKRSRNETVEELLLLQVHHEFLLWEGCTRDAKSRVREAESKEETFTLVAWIRAFNINEPIYAKLCHEFYSTYEFDEVCADDELLGLYQAVELEEDGFSVYFEGGLRSDDKFLMQRIIGFELISPERKPLDCLSRNVLLYYQES